MFSIITSVVSAWIAAQFLKILWGLAKYGRDDISRIPWRILWAGGMPSAHSAVVTAATVTILFHSGARSMMFGLSLIFSLIIIYDRLRMRSIYKTFQARYPLLRAEMRTDPMLKDLMGHTVPEVVMGILTGVCVGFTIL